MQNLREEKAAIYLKQKLIKSYYPKETRYFLFGNEQTDRQINNSVVWWLDVK